MVDERLHACRVRYCSFWGSAVLNQLAYSSSASRSPSRTRVSVNSASSVRARGAAFLHQLPEQGQRRLAIPDCGEPAHLASSRESMLIVGSWSVLHPRNLSGPAEHELDHAWLFSGQERFSLERPGARFGMWFSLRDDRRDDSRCRLEPSRGPGRIVEQHPVPRSVIGTERVFSQN